MTTDPLEMSLDEKIAFIPSRRCPKCGETKPLSAFHRDRTAASGASSYCKPCGCDYASAWAKANPERNRATYAARRAARPDVVRAQRRKSRLAIKYGLTPADHDAMRVAQDNRCLICKQPAPRLVVDHNHETGKVRGLLCDGCNRGLGHFGDDPNLLVVAADYVRTRA